MFWSQTFWLDKMFASQAYLMRLNVSIPVSSHLRIWWDEIFDHRLNVCIPGLPDEHSELVSLQWRWCHLPCGAQGEPEIRPCLKGKRQTVKGKVGNILKIKTLWLNFSTSPAGLHRPVLPRTGLHHLDSQPLCYEVNHFSIINNYETNINKYHVRGI